jgi:hypothetical protein
VRQCSSLRRLLLISPCDSRSLRDSDCGKAECIHVRSMLMMSSWVPKAARMSRTSRGLVSTRASRARRQVTALCEVWSQSSALG